jgi:hypothetical protein
VVVIPLWTPPGSDRETDAHAALLEAGKALRRRAVRAASGPGWLALRGSAFLRKHVKLAAQAHG